MVIHKKTPTGLGGGSWEIEHGSEDSLSPDIQQAHLAVVSDVEGGDWVARLVDVSLGNPDVKEASFFTVLTRRVEREYMGRVSGTRPMNLFEQSAEPGGQRIRTLSGQNPLWESRLAGLKGQPTCDPAGTAAPAFGDLATVRSMGTGQRSHVIGFDTEFTYVTETERVIDSYQFSCLDPVDDGSRIDVVILPLQGQRILVEDALYIVVRAAGLHRLVEGLHPRGVARRDFWENGDYKGSLDALFKHRVPLVLAGHYLPADLTAFARPARQRRGGEKYNDLLRRVTSASGGLVGLNPIRVVRRGGRSDGSRWMPMSVIVRDTMGQVAPGQKTLAALGKSCGVEKLDIGESISDMSALRRDHLLEFLEYGANDSVIVLEYLGALWGLNTVPPVTISGGGAHALRDGVMDYWGIDSPADFRMRFQGLVELSTAQAEGNDGDDGLSYYAVRDLAPVDGDANQTHTAWKRAFHGGWNGCIAPGYHPYPTYDHDIQSAYPSAMASIYDVDYVGGAIDKVIKDRELTLDDFDHGPITPMVAYTSWEFPDDTVAPCLPVRSGDSVIYPLTSHGCGAAQGDEVDGYQGFEGAWCAGPELYLALQLGAQVTVQIGYTMRVMDAPDENEDGSRSLRSALRQMVADRAIAKEVFGKGSLEEQTIKVGTNSCYGKLAQDVAERNGWDAWEEQMESIGGSAVTSPYHASMTTSLVRALLLAVANEIEILSVTTDGFITAVEEIESLECFGIADAFRDARLALADDPTVWEVKHEQDDLVNLSTRGNVSLSDSGVLAKAGLKTPKSIEHGSVEERRWFRSTALSREGKVPNPYTSFPTFRELSRSENRKDFHPVKRNPRVSTLDFDLKRRPDMSTLRADIVDGHDFAGFGTVPWQSVTDYERARGIARHMQDVRPGTTGEDRPSGCLRTGDDWRTWEKRFSSMVGRRVRTADDALLTELVAGHKEGWWSLPVLASKLTVADKLTWLSGLGYGDFTRAQWDHMSKRGRRARVLDNADMDLLTGVVEEVLVMDSDAA